MREWDLYFSTIVGWQCHPGYLREGARPLSLEECADLADQIMEIRNRRFQQWDSQQQQAQ